nr:Uncharacterised protein [Klebsiella pneumoniae]
MTHRHVVFGFFDIVFSITTLFIVYNYFSESKVVFVTKKSSRIRNLLKVIIVLFLFWFQYARYDKSSVFSHLTNFVYSSVVSLPSSPLTNTIDEFVACEVSVE